MTASTAAAAAKLPSDELVATLARNWWMLTLRGVFAILFGVLTWLQPGLSLKVLILTFGVYAFADGVIGAWSAISGRKTESHWWAWLLWALISVFAGIFTFISPEITAMALLFYIGFWAIASGVMEIVTGIRLRKAIQGEWLLMLGGLASVLFGVVILARPGVGALAMMWLIAFYAVAFGIILVMLGNKLRRHASSAEAAPAAA
jgi:uncharacterized membrane protein HdeD (DUF308 family)